MAGNENNTNSFTKKEAKKSMPGGDKVPEFAKQHNRWAGLNMQQLKIIRN